MMSHGWNVSLGKMLDSACLDCVMLKNVGFIIAGMLRGKQVGAPTVPSAVIRGSN
jgi:hypothetical protein